MRFNQPCQVPGATLPRALRILVAATAVVVALAASSARADLPSDLGPGPTVLTLPVPAPKHWVWVNDFVFAHMADGMAYLVDADNGRYLGTLSTGYSFEVLALSRDGKLIYSPETYFSRGTRGTRTDVVTIYDASTLAPVGEIPIPAKRASNMPNTGNAVLTEDGRFLLVFNFNPGSSVTVVDTVSRQFVGEIETPGCALIYPTGPRTFFTLCGDGGALVVELDEHGAAARQARTGRLFDIDKDPITEKGVHIGATWYFVTFDGRVVPIEASQGTVRAGDSWWLTSKAERAQGWRPGGLQQLAVHAGENRLYAIMHQGSRDTHKDPGKAVWVYDLATRHRVLSIATPGYVSSIQVSTDNAPLLYGIFIEGTDLYVFDAHTGRLRRTIDHIGTSPTLIVTP
jgi:methylamine dehydrogenase heavy chain